MVKLIASLAVATTFASGSKDAAETAFVYEMSDDQAPYATTSSLEVRTTVIVRGKQSRITAAPEPTASNRILAHPPRSDARLLYAAQGAETLSCLVEGTGVDGDLVCRVRGATAGEPITLVWHTGEITEAQRIE